MITKRTEMKPTSFRESRPRVARWVMATLGLVIAVGFAGTAAQASVIHVPADEPTIQAAVDAAVSGDTIMVAPGEYAGAWIEKTVKIIGSGPDTRITTGTPPWGDGFDVYDVGAADTEISNLAIEVLGPSTGGVAVMAADNCTVRDLKVTATWCGIYCEFSDNVVITGNTISGTLYHGIWARVVNSASITKNTITGEMYRAIKFNWASDSVISDNTIDRVISPPTHDWWNGAIATDNCATCTIRGNVIRGEGRSAIHLSNTDDSIIIGNDCSGFTANWDGVMIPKRETGLCQMYFGLHSDRNKVSGNVWGSVPSDGVAVVFVSRRGSPSGDLEILDNDYRQCGVPGWAKTDGPGCVLLENGTRNSFVFESGNFPPGTGGAKNQVVDLTAELQGSTTNRVVGHPAGFLLEDLNPGVGQRLQEILDQLEALPEPGNAERP